APAPAAQETLVDAAIGGAAYVAPVACPHLDGFQRRDVLNVCFPCAQGSDKFRFRQQAHLRNRAGGVTTANADALARAGPTAGSQRHDIDAFRDDRTAAVQRQPCARVSLRLDQQLTFAGAPAATQFA